MIDYEYLKPKTLDEVLSLLESYGDRAILIAGGTDVMVNIRNKKLAPEALVSIRNLTDLAYIKKDDGYHIGALTTHRMLETSPLIREELSALYDGASQVGSVQIRNVATVGGNICNAAPSADTAAPLLSLDATAVLKGPKGTRKVSLKDFFTGPSQTVREKDEVLVEFEIPAAMGEFGSAYHKHSRRKAMDLPILGVAVSLKVGGDTIEDARIGLSVAAPTPIRAMKAEEYLRGKPFQDEVLEEAGKIAAQEASPRDSLRGQAWYRREVIEIFVPRMAVKAYERLKKQS
ncbi:MAG: xanthine dehydrogenase family protein subunit M [Deltaproteobacteria bacterium]|nr:MAG: xanthine dehydrogenase family protein subunit M [Deltaproteobacteria bacterium]